MSSSKYLMQNKLLNCMSEVVSWSSKIHFVEVFGIIAVAIFSTILTSSSAEAQFSRGDGSLEPAVTTCNIVTGVATGLDAGRCASPAAICNGVANDRNAFNAFNKWARATTTNANGQLLELYVPSGSNCMWLSASVSFNFVMAGVKNGRISAYGATFSNPKGNGFYLASNKGICQKGLNEATGCSARINTVSAGATAVNITNTAFCSRFVTDRWAVVTGFDLQGGYGSPYGFPPNPHFFEYVQIGSTENCATTGWISLRSALTNSYLSTWPNFNSGNANEADNGGPATIYALDANWDTHLDIRGLTIDSTCCQIIPIGRSIAIRDMTMVGSHCVIPSQNGSFTMTNSTGTSCAIEVDKLIGTLNYSGTTLRRLMFQSSSTNYLNWDGGSLILDLNGTPKVATISNLTTPTIRLGPYAYGVATSATCTNCVATNDIPGFGLTDTGTAFYDVRGGVFTYPMGANVTNLTDNGSGKVRITVADTTGWKSGNAVGKSGSGSVGGALFATCAVPGCSGIDPIISVIDNTHIDFTNFNFADVTWSGGGFIFNRAEQTRWAIPGTNFFTTGQWPATSGAWQSTGVTQSGGFVQIATTIPGGFPTVPLSSGAAGVRVQAPYWTCTNCSGSAQMLDFSGAPPNIPIFSYSNRTFSNSTPLRSWSVWGRVTSIKINVTQAYTGSTSPLRANLPEETVIPAGTTTFWSPLINLRQAGLRTITPAGVTCDTGGGPVAGACSGDSALTLPDPAAMFAGTVEQQMPNGTPKDSPWAMTVEFMMDQGVVP